MARDHGNSSYYDKGSTEPSVASSLTVRKLERRRQLTLTSERLVIVLVGLPGRGKSFIGRKLHSFLTWRGDPCKVFNVGKYRRQAHRAEINRTRSNSLDSADTCSESAQQREEAGSCDANFFDSKNEEATRLREEVAKIALQDMLQWLSKENEMQPIFEGETNESDNVGTKGKALRSVSRCRVAIFDATNTTKARRDVILESCSLHHLRTEQPIGVVFVESICDDKELLDENYRYKISSSPDFKGLSPEEALNDLRIRAENYEERYDPIDDDNLSYIKIFNLSSKIMANQIYGRMSKVIVPALMAWNIGDRPIYLCRAGKVFDDEEYVFSDNGGNGLFPHISVDKTLPPKRGSRRPQSTGLGSHGISFRNALRDFIENEGNEFMSKRTNAISGLMTGTSVTGTSTLITGIRARSDHDEEIKKEEKSDEKVAPLFPCFVMTSTMPRAIESATWDTLPFDVNQYSNLNPINKGDYSGMELSDIKEVHPEWYEQLEKDPFRTRFPGGESYHDLVSRLETTIIDMEQQVAPVVVVSHVSVLQCLLAYFRGSPVEECTTTEVPMHTVIKVSPLRGGGWRETRHHLSGVTDASDVDSSGSDSGEENIPRSPIWGDHVRTKN